MNNEKTLMIPQHIAVIMDGNRRWSRENHLPVFAGHKKVVDKILEPLIETASDLGIKFMTFWAFSTENWGREKKEIDYLMKLFRISFKKFGEKMHRRGCRILIIGDIGRFPPDIQETIEYLTNLTRDNTRITTIFALNYGGRDEIIRAINKIQKDLKFQIENLKLNEEFFSSYLDTSGIPDPDLIIRTGGEQRLSGFLIWQSQYSELYFPKFYMPDFTPERLDEAIFEFNHRQRRFGC